MPESKEDIDTWKQALWDFVLEHCEMLDSGTLFVKFHTSGRADLEKRIRARWKYNYHREDVRGKEGTHETKQEIFKRDKKLKNEIWKAEKKERIRVLERVKRSNERRIFLRKWLGWTGLFRSEKVEIESGGIYTLTSVEHAEKEE